jgi:hypothetical protein
LYYVCNGEKNKNKKTKKMLPDILEMLLEILDRISGKVCSDITSQLPINEASKFGFLIFGTQESHSIHKPIHTFPTRRANPCTSSPNTLILFLRMLIWVIMTWVCLG